MIKDKGLKKKENSKEPNERSSLLSKIKSSKLYAKCTELLSDVKDSLDKKHYYSLYLELALTAAFGVLISASIYIAAQTGASLFINTQLSNDIKKLEREREYISDIQKYVMENDISLKRADKISSFDISNYVQIVVYNDIPRENTEIAERATRDEMISYAAENGMYVIDLTDASVMISVNDFSEFYYYNVSASINFVSSLSILVLIMLNRMRKMIRRIKRLQSDVAVVSYSDMNHEITVDGNNDIAKLASNVETMRIAMLDNLRKEKEARDANTELITSLSHDIRTPLTVMLGYLEMMEKKSVDDEMREYIEIAEQTAMRLKLLSDDMFKYFLTYGNTEEKIKIEEYNAATLIFQMLTEHIVLLGERGYEVKFNRDELRLDENTNVITDADNLMRIFDNIFSNLHKYADPDAPISIDISSIGDILEIKFENRVAKDISGAESNKIGLKTCSRLAEFILEGFEYSKHDDVFTTRMAIKTTVASAMPEIQPIAFNNNI